MSMWQMTRAHRTGLSVQTKWPVSRRTRFRHPRVSRSMQSPVHSDTGLSDARNVTPTGKLRCG